MTSDPLSQEPPPQRIVYVNGRFVPAESATISVFDRGFLFADSIYEVTAVVRGRLIDADHHYCRLRRSLASIRISVDSITSIAADPSLSAGAEQSKHPHSSLEGYLDRIQNELIRRNRLSEGVVYMQFTRGACVNSLRQLVPHGSERPTLVMFTQPVTVVRPSIPLLRVATTPDLRWKRRDVKTTMLLPNMLSKWEHTDDEAYDDVWMVDEDGFVTEGSSNNAFLVFENDNITTIVTAACGTDILPGVTRRAVLALAEEWSSSSSAENAAAVGQLKVQERRFTVTEAQEDATEAFCTSSSTLVRAVVAINGVAVGNGQVGPVSKRLREKYVELLIDDDDADERNYC